MLTVFTRCAFLAAAAAVLLAKGSAAFAAIPPDVRFDFGPGAVAPGYTQVLPAMAYMQERGYGFLYAPALEAVSGTGAALRGDAIVSSRPFYFAVDVPEGNYEVTLTLGDPVSASATTVKAESRRLMVEHVATTSGAFETRTFIVNVRTSRLPDGSEVRLKDREVGAFHWDGQLTLEFNGDRPAVAAVAIRRVYNAVTVFLAGNSTVTDQTREPWAAWGQMLPRFFGPGVAVANHAESGETLKAFVAEGRLAKVLSQIQPGDYLFIQFAHNDQKPGVNYVAPFTGYKALLKHFIDEARSRDARPVLVTSMHRRTFDDAGRIINSHGDFPEAMRQTATEEGVPLIDLHAASATLYEALGVEGSKQAFVHYPAGSFPDQDEALADDSHHSPYGAYMLARAVVAGIQAHVPDLARYLVDGIEPFDPAAPDSPDTWALPASPQASILKPDGN